MKNSALLMMAALPFFAFGCATVHPGHKANQVSGDPINGLEISVEELTDPSTEAFSMYSITFENTSADWSRIQGVDVVIGPEVADKVSVVRGQDLVDWASAMQARADLERHNQSMTQFTIAMLAAGAAVASKNEQQYMAGLSGVAAVQAWVWADIINDSKFAAQTPKAVPANHIGRPFSIPAKLFLRRWVLLNKPIGQRITELVLQVHFVDGRSSVVNVGAKGYAQ